MNPDSLIRAAIADEERENGPLYLTPTVHKLLRTVAKTAYSAAIDANRLENALRAGKED